MKPIKRWYLLLAVVGIIFIAEKSSMKALRDWITTNPLTHQTSSTNEIQQLRNQTTIQLTTQTNAPIPLIIGGFSNYSTQEFAFAKYCENKKPLVVLCFTPQHDCTGLLVHLIDHANGEVHVHAYALTCPLIIAALKRADSRGVIVRILLDKQYKNKPQVAPLRKTELYADNTPQIAHGKVLLIKNKNGLTVVYIGSFNFSTSAQKKNFEICLFLFNYDELYEACITNWKARLQLKRTERLLD